MRIIRHIIFVLPLTAFWVCSCSDNGTQVSIPEMIRPVLSAKDVYDIGENIVITVTFPASDWDLVKRQKEAIDSDDFWPWYLRINGKYFRLDGGAVPLFPPTDSSVKKQTREYSLNNNNSFTYPESEINWEPGEYKVAYVFRDITLHHPLAPEQEVHLEEWVSNEVTFRVTDRAE